MPPPRPNRARIIRYEVNPIIVETKVVISTLWGTSGSSLVYCRSSTIRLTSMVRAVVMAIRRAFNMNARAIVVGRKEKTERNVITKSIEKI